MSCPGNRECRSQQTMPGPVSLRDWNTREGGSSQRRSPDRQMLCPPGSPPGQCGGQVQGVLPVPQDRAHAGGDGEGLPAPSRGPSWYPGAGASARTGKRISSRDGGLWLGQLCLPKHTHPSPQKLPGHRHCQDPVAGMKRKAGQDQKASQGEDSPPAGRIPADWVCAGSPGRHRGGFPCGRWATLGDMEEE